MSERLVLGALREVVAVELALKSGIEWPAN